MLRAWQGPDKDKDQHLNNIDCLSGEDVRCIVAVLLPGDGHVGAEVITPTILQSVHEKVWVICLQIYKNNASSLAVAIQIIRHDESRDKEVLEEELPMNKERDMAVMQSWPSHCHCLSVGMTSQK